ncbi:MAG: hypothetical protein WBD07_16480 [Vicinamibacterales bacterium]
MKAYIHARLAKGDYAVLRDLKKATGHSESQLVRRGLRLVLDELGRRRSALDVAGQSVGRFRRGPADLSTNKKRLEGFGK